jgi:hypothetical protein
VVRHTTNAASINEEIRKLRRGYPHGGKWLLGRSLRWNWGSRCAGMRVRTLTPCPPLPEVEVEDEGADQGAQVGVRTFGLGREVHCAGGERRATCCTNVARGEGQS